jgi:hypothetical protein
MPLWTDLINPGELTGYARAALDSFEAQKGSLARYLPNRQVFDIVARFVAGSNGLVEEAKWRAYDAEIEVGKRKGGRRVTLELPAVGQTIPVTEYAQLRTRNASDDTLRNEIFKTTDQVVRATANAVERLRGTVLVTGIATIAELGSADNFGRSGAHTVTAATLWNAGGAKPLDDLVAWVDTYRATNGVDPGVIVMATRVFRILASDPALRTNINGGGYRPATAAEVNGLIESLGLPPIEINDRRTASGRIIPDDRVLLLPAPVAPDDSTGTELGGTFWGQTLTSQEPDYSIAQSDQPGIVTGVYRGDKPPLIAEVVGDAIALPVLANADLSLAARVL